MTKQDIEIIIKEYCQKRCGYHAHKCPNLCEVVKFLHDVQDKTKEGQEN